MCSDSMPPRSPPGWRSISSTWQCWRCWSHAANSPKTKRSREPGHAPVSRQEVASSRHIGNEARAAVLLGKFGSRRCRRRAHGAGEFLPHHLDRLADRAVALAGGSRELVELQRRLAEHARTQHDLFAQLADIITDGLEIAQHIGGNLIDTGQVLLSM